MPHLWMSHEAALRTSPSGHAGFGFHKDDAIFGIDLDDCIINGELTPVAKKIVEAANTYTEVSWSGTGLKLWVLGRPSNRLRCVCVVDGQTIELYKHGRWFLSTGNQYGTQDKITDGKSVLQLLEQITPTPEVQARPEFQPREQSPSDLAHFCANYPPAISGQNGHGTTIKLACSLAAKGCDVNTIIFLMDTHWNPNCTPKWSRRELEHKALDAIKLIRKGR